MHRKARNFAMQQRAIKREKRRLEAFAKVVAGGGGRTSEA